MDSKSKRQRYTKQWKYARRSLNERVIGEESSELSDHSTIPHPITSQHISDTAASQLLLEEPQCSTAQCSSEVATKNYRTKVLQKLQEIADNQQDVLAMQRSILAAVTEEGGDILESGPCQTVEEFHSINSVLENKEKRLKMMNYLRSLGGSNPGAAVRRMLRKIATNEVLGAFSLKGKKGKRPFKDLNVCSIIIGATQKNFQTLKASDVEDLIGMVLKFAPHRNLK